MNMLYQEIIGDNAEKQKKSWRLSPVISLLQIYDKITL
jgi:hypothetical protein